jgi:hypothetical protein
VIEISRTQVNGMADDGFGVSANQTTPDGAGLSPQHDWLHEFTLHELASRSIEVEGGMVGHANCDSS